MVRKIQLIIIYLLCFVVECNADIQISDTSGIEDSTIVHIVKEGETLYSIARRYHVTVDHILSYHPEFKESTLCEDDTLEFPCLVVPSNLNSVSHANILPTVSGDIEGHNYVDLGLKSGIKWATCNIGAANPWEYGDYFSWGETNKISKAGHKWCKGEKTIYIHICDFTKYCNDSMFGQIDNKTTLELNDDAAYVNLGKDWRMPTINEFNELLEFCDWIWVDNYLETGFAGCLGISKTNGKSIFFPAAGNMYNEECFVSQSIGLYWSSDLHIEYPVLAEAFRFDSSQIGTDVTLNTFRDYQDITWQENYRIWGLSVRAVSNYTIPICEEKTSTSIDRDIVTVGKENNKDTNNNYVPMIIVLITLLFVAFVIYVWYQVRDEEEQVPIETPQKRESVVNQQRKVSAGKQKEQKDNNTIKQQEIGQQNSKPIEKISNSGLTVDNRNTFYRLEDINTISIEREIEIAPYDARWIKVPDAKILPLLTKSAEITKYLPHLGFSDETSTRRQLFSYCYKTENQLGVTYVIRVRNLPVGMIFVNTPLFNKKAINIAIWTVDFYISQMFEHKGFMYNSLIRVLNEMRKNMGAVKVYAMVDRNNVSCKKLLTKALFVEIDNTNFHDYAGGNKPLVYEIDLSKIN